MKNGLVSIKLYEENGAFKFQIKENFKEKLNICGEITLQRKDLEDIEIIASKLISLGEMILQEKLRIKK